MKAIQKYLEEKNAMNKFFCGKDLSFPQDREKLAMMVEGDLSPENLTCDGELPRAQVQKRAVFLQRVRAELEKH